MQNMIRKNIGIYFRFIVLFFINGQIRMPDRSLTGAELPTGFVRSTGVPNTTISKAYFASATESVARCAADPKCVGVSGQRMFYGSVGNPAIVQGRPGEGGSFLRSATTQPVASR